ncbi:DUF4249 domain-containing protein [Aquimarina longa]|uniref:DUF4249 domain-containing protein n=1 Tax=Aquimarina longa TaxID=1080221 RepID=UPI0007841821|nr:DUF4249 domain-containing protein [Aquimarina longa]
MKTYIISVLSIVIIAFTSCTDVVNVDIPKTDSRLVIEASLDWEKGTSGNVQTIKLSESTPYFDSVVYKKVVGASVKVINDNDGTDFIFIDQNDGTYTIADFVPVLNQSYTLEVIYNNETYIAKETMTPVSDISNIEQSKDKGTDTDAIEIKVFFNDPVNEKNFYLVKFLERGDVLPLLGYDSDEFTNGNEKSFEFEKLEDKKNKIEEFVPGDIIDIKLFGASERYYNYMRLLIGQSEGSGDAFSTIPAPLRGNCINTTNKKNYAFGYFRLTQSVSKTYTIL